jgi:hypothetical protein
MTKTYIATNKPDKVILVEDGEISHAINPNCNEWADYEEFIANGGTLIEQQPSEAHVFINGSWQLDEQLQAQQQREYRNKCVDAVSAYIQAEVDNYNETNEVAFDNVHNCKSYADDETYEHYAFCSSVWEWNKDVWTTARGILADVKAGTREIHTVDELIAELPVFNG